MSRRHLSRASGLLAVCLSTGASPAVAASDTQTIVAGKEFDRGGKWRYWFGDGYRKAWTMPAVLPVLDLSTEAGGLTPLRQIGGFHGG